MTYVRARKGGVMRRAVTEEERQVLMANPELVMFMPRHQGMHPTVFLLVIPVIAMVILGAILWLTGAGKALIDTFPMGTAFAYVAICTATPWVCLYIKRRYDDAYGCDRELRRLLARELEVGRVRITGVVPQRAEIYAVAGGEQFIIGIASTRNTFVPDVGTDIAILYAGETAMGVRPDPRTKSLLR